MPVLTNRKYEAFARALFEGIPKGVTQGQAYFTAGYKATGGVAEAAACRLLKNVPAIANRVAELQGALAKRKEITVASLVDDFMRLSRSRKLTARPVPWSPPAHSKLEWQDCCGTKSR